MYSEQQPYDKEKLLDEILREEPGFSLPGDFADRLAAVVGRKISWKNYWSEFLVYLGAVVALAAVSAGMALIWFGADWKSWAGFLTENLSLAAGIVVLVVFVLFADRVLLRYFLDRNQSMEN